MPHPPIRIHPANPKIFEFRGAPRVLICATEHYGSVLNRPFDFEKYLADAVNKKQNYTRLFLLFRELASDLNPHSTCKPESADYISPFPRTGPGLACDGQPKYDLDQWNPEFFERLHRFLSTTSKAGIVVEVVLLSNSYWDNVWELNPLHDANNINGLDVVRWTDYTSARNPKLFARQSAHVRKIVEEVNRYDNIFFEICNEPGGAVSTDSATTTEVNEWQMALAGIIREMEAKLPNQHLIAGQEAFAYTLPDESKRTGPDVHQFADLSFDGLDFDVVNMHPLSNMILRGKNYDIGPFMTARMRLANFQQYCRDIHRESKPFNLDEDNCATRFKDVNAWTIHRKRAWTTIFCGGHYDMIDFSINNHCETGSPESQRSLRLWMKYLTEFVHSLDLVRSQPLAVKIPGLPGHVVASAFGVDQDFSVYLADARELDESGHGEPIDLALKLPLEPHKYAVRFFSPVTGIYSATLSWSPESGTLLELPTFTHDLVVRISRTPGPA